MRKLVERDGLSERSASRVLAHGKPYTWETLRKAYAELKEAGELPDKPPVSQAHEELVRRTYQQWRDTLDRARSDRDTLARRLRDLGIEFDGVSAVELMGLEFQLRTRQENLERLATASPAVAAEHATRLHPDEESALAAIKAARIEYEELEEKRRALTRFIEARETAIGLEAKLYPVDG